MRKEFEIKTDTGRKQRKTHSVKRHTDCKRSEQSRNNKSAKQKKKEGSYRRVKAWFLKESPSS